MKNRKTGIAALLLACMAALPLAAQQPAVSTTESGNMPEFAEYTQPIPGTEVSFEMVAIPEGKFTIGSPETEASRAEDEGPRRTVKIEPFWMGKYEVTFDEYEVFREKNLDKAPEGEEENWDADAVTRPSPPYEDPTFGMGKYGYPAASMTQYAALSYCKWLTEKTGVFYRLPTEAEWEYACRAGAETAFYFGDSVAHLNEHAWYYDNSNDVYHKVGQKKPNAWGLYDMHGNVAEWTLDQYVEDFYASIEDGASSPWSKPASLHPRTVKGGSYYDDPEQLRSAARTKSSMNWKKRDPQIPKSFWWNTDSPFVGFRVVRPYNQPSPEELADFWSATLDQ